MEEKKKKRHRRQRRSTGKRIDVTWDDIRHILHPIDRYQCLDTKTIIAINPLCAGWVQRRLKHFFHEDNTPHGGPYLDRTRLRPPDNDDREIDHSPDIHMLSERADHCLNEHLPHRMRPITQFGHTTSHHMRHKIFDASFHASFIELGIMKTDIKPVFWYDILASSRFPEATKTVTDPFSIPLPPSRNYNGKQTHYESDGLIGLEYPQQPGQKTPYRFCPIEIDAHNMPIDSRKPRNSAISKKFDDLLAAMDAGLFREHLGLPNMSIHPLFITDSQARMELMITLLQRKHEERNGKKGAERFGFQCFQFERPTSLVPMPDPDMFLKPSRTIAGYLDLTTPPW